MIDRIKRIIPGYAHLPLIICGVTQIIAYGLTKYVTLFDVVDMTLPIDRRMPFRPEWVLVYVLSYVFWIVGYIAIARESRAHCMRLFRADIVGKIVCAAFFVFMPTTIVRPQIAGNGLFDWMLGLIYAMDAPCNLFPSMHCFFSWLVARELMRIKRIPVPWRIGAVVFSLLVFASTVLTYQHVVIDIFGGAALAEIAIFVSGRLEKRRIAK